MSQATISPPLNASLSVSQAPRWRPMAIAVWLIVLGVAIAINVKVAPGSFHDMANLEDIGSADTEKLRQGLADIGISARTLAYFTVIQVVLGWGLQLTLAVLFLRVRTVMATMLAIGLIALTAAQYPPSIPENFPDQPVWIFLARSITVLGMSFFFYLPYLFPSGRFVPRWTWISVPFAVFSVAQFAFFPDFEVIGWHHGVADGITTIAFFGGALVSQVYRYRKVSSEVERQQTKWIVYGFAITIPGFIIGDAAIRSFDDGSGSVLALLVFIVVMPVMEAALPITLAIAILRHRLFDIDLIINRTLVYLVLTGSVVGSYALLVVGVGRLIDARNNLVLSLIATGIVAVGFQPLRQRVQRGVNRLLYGDRDDPYRVLSRLGQRLEGTIAPDEILPTIVRTLTEALRLPYVAISVLDGTTPVLASASGTPASAGIRLPLVYQAEPVGELIVAPRSPGETFGPADRRLLEDLARQAGIAAHAVRLTADLQRARERLVTAREEERRRLRRDLHDGLGAQLSALAIQAGALRGQISRDPAEAEAAAAELRAELKASVAEIRRLVHGLRPPSLDELGLVGAIRERARRFEGTPDGLPDSPSLQVTLHAPDDLPQLPAAVEVAVFRIVEEALTNVSRHAGARRCEIELDMHDRTVLLEIRDDGIGVALGAATGVGLLSMRERAAELGGDCQIGPNPALEAGGTHVAVSLPLPA